MFDDDALLRHSRQVFLPQIDIAGQEALCDANVLVVGLGGLGSITALLLVGCGIGRISLLDSDAIELSNLGRQVAYCESDIGQPKASTLALALKARNASATITSYVNDFAGWSSEHDLSEYHVVLDCTDNFATRYAINKACVTASVPLVSGAAIGGEGQLASFDFSHQPSPCYHCLFPGLDEEADSCSESGVLVPVPNVIGGLQVVETIKLLLPKRKQVEPFLLSWNAWQQAFRKTRIVADPACQVCSD